MPRREEPSCKSALLETVGQVYFLNVSGSSEGQPHAQLIFQSLTLRERGFSTCCPELPSLTLHANKPQLCFF